MAIISSDIFANSAAGAIAVGPSDTDYLIKPDVVVVNQSGAAPAIAVFANLLRLTNLGLVQGYQDGIAAGGDVAFEIRNLAGASIYGRRSAITAGGALNLTLVNDGLVESLNDITIDASVAGSVATIINGGTIRVTNGASAIVLTGSDNRVANSGLILGNVLLGAGDDVFNGRGGSLVGSVVGGAGDDLYVIDAAVDLVELAGEGIDEVVSFANHALEDNFELLTLAGPTAIRGTGNALANGITGSGADNILSGEEGNDTIFGGAGWDRISGGLGIDRLYGDSGDDILEGGPSQDLLAGGAGADRLTGGPGIDIADYRSSPSRVVVLLARGLEAQTGGDATGDVIQDIENIFGSAYSDVLFGDQKNNRLVGGSGNDGLSGSGGDDVLDGGDGLDVLTGARGNDMMSGGADADRFVMADVFSPGGFWGDDTITDFENGADLIDFTDARAVHGFGDLTISQQGGDTLILTAGNSDDSITLKGFLAVNLDAGDFIFA